MNCFWFRTTCFITFREKCCFSKDAGQPKALAEIITFLQVFFMFYNIIPIATYSTAVLFCILGNFYHEIFRKEFFSRLFWPSFSEIACLEKGLGVELWIKNLLTNCIFWFFWVYYLFNHVTVGKVFLFDCVIQLGQYTDTFTFGFNMAKFAKGTASNSSTLSVLKAVCMALNFVC